MSQALIILLNTLTAAFSLLAAAFGAYTAYLVVKDIKRKPRPDSTSGPAPGNVSSRAKRTLPLTLIFLTLAVSTFVAQRRMRIPEREIAITTPTSTATLQVIKEGADISYVFDATGTCPQCDAEERVQLMLLPPQGGDWIPQRAVTVSNGRWRYNRVYIGNQENPIRDGDIITIQAVVVHERDAVPERTRLANPTDVVERGQSLVVEIAAKVGRLPG